MTDQAINAPVGKTDKDKAVANDELALLKELNGLLRSVNQDLRDLSHKSE